MKTVSGVLFKSAIESLIATIGPTFFLCVPDEFRETKWYFYLSLILLAWATLFCWGGKRNAVRYLMCTLVACHFLRPIKRNEYCLFMVVIYLYSIVDYPFLDFKRHNRPVYLAMSKKPMVCKSFLERFQGSKHWMVVVPGGLKYYVFHVKGRIVLGLKPSFEVVEPSHLENICSHAYRLGFTSKYLLRKYREMKFTMCHTCQQYTGISTMALVRPQGAVCILNKLYGRFTFMILLVASLIIYIISRIVGIWIPIDLLMYWYIQFDFLREAYPDSDNSWVEEVRGFVIVVGSFLFFFFFYSNVYFNGVIFVVSLSHALIIMLMNLLFVPSFTEYHKKMAKRSC